MNIVIASIWIIVVGYLIVPVFIIFMWSVVALFLMITTIVLSVGVKWMIEKIKSQFDEVFA